MNSFKGPDSYSDKNMQSFFSVKEMDDNGKFTGYASIFGKVDLQGEVVERGSFSRTIKNRKGDPFPVLWQHNPEKPIGLAVVEEDDKGLLVSDGTLDLNISQAKDAYHATKSKIVRGMSIGFKVTKDSWGKDGVRKLKEINLFEVSLVTFPAQPLARIRTIKSLGEVSRKYAEGADEDESALFKASAAALGLRGDIPEEEIPQLKNYLGYCYRKIGRVPPWEQQDDFIGIVRHVVDLKKYVENGSEELQSLLSRLENSSSKKATFSWEGDGGNGLDFNPFEATLKSMENYTKELKDKWNL